PEQHDARRLHKQLAQIAVSTFGYAPQDRPSASGGLLRHETEPGGKIAAFFKDVTLADACHRGAGNDRALNAFIKPAPVAGEVLDNMQHAWGQPVGHAERTRQLG